jgi:hypothetical protein
MTDYLALACKTLEVDEGQVVASRVDEATGEIYVLVDRGINGIPKYTLSLAKLDELVEEEVDEGPDYKSMSYKDLRAAARVAKIPGYTKMNKAKLLEALQAL